MATPLVIGMTLRFKSEGSRREYGETATITDVRRSISRPYGTITTWISMTTIAGREIEWSLSTVRERMTIEGGGPWPA